MPVIRISDELFSRLEAYAVGFDTPSAVIERLLNEHENKINNTTTSKPVSTVKTENQPSSATYGQQMTTSFKNEITKIHDEIFQFLLNYKKQYPDFYFMPRQKGERLENGYWFPGDENYLVIGFYTGADTFNKTPNITFQIYLSDFYLKTLKRKQVPTSVIQLSNTPESSGWLSKKPVMEKIIEKLGGFEVNRTTNGIEARWNRYYDSKDYLKCLEEFLTKDKPVIDDIIKKAENSEIRLLDKKKSEDKINKINQRRMSS
jgi:hypothetical protein